MEIEERGEGGKCRTKAGFGFGGLRFILVDVENPKIHESPLSSCHQLLAVYEESVSVSV
jgi:hypothetical protein